MIVTNSFVFKVRFCKIAKIVHQDKLNFSIAYFLTDNSISDGGKPEIFQNPGFGFNPGFEIKNPGFSGSKLVVIRDLETG